MLYFENFRFDPCDGYGSFSTNLVKHLMDIGENVYPIFTAQIKSNNKLVNLITGFNSKHKLISCIPPSSLCTVSNVRYLYTMCECDKLPIGWADKIRRSNIEKIFVPSVYCQQTFADSGIESTVILAGTNPDHFPVIYSSPDRPFTFLLLADRGYRKGWMEGWQAFFNEFNSIGDVQLLIKYREDDNAHLLNKLAKHTFNDTRIKFIGHDISNIHNLYKQVDCVVIPSHAEGWGMPHREAAMSGLPVITLKYSGLDDGNIEKWSIPVTNYKLIPVDVHPDLAGQCALPDVDELGSMMKMIYNNREYYKQWAVYSASTWLVNNQTWDITASELRSEIYDT